MKFISCIIFSILLSFLFSACDTTENNTNPNPPGYQEDIPWNSTSGLSWDLPHGDPQMTGRSKSVGPLLGQLLWSNEIPTTAPGEDSFLSPVVDDSIVYFVSYRDTGTTGSNLYALRIADGSLKWKFPLKFYKSTTPPIVSRTGNIYVSDWRRNLYSINKSGQLNWKLTLDVDVSSSMNIGKDETIYAFQSDGSVIAITSAGSVKWKTLIPNEFGSSSSAIAFSPDGNTIYVTGEKLNALSTDGSIKWRYIENGWVNTFITHPLVDAQGNIYIYGAAVKISPDGIRQPWIPITQEFAVYNIEAAIDRNGNFYIGLYTGEIACISYQAELKWKKQLNIQYATSIICDNSANVYFIGSDGSINMIDSNGNIKWSYSFEGIS